MADIDSFFELPNRDDFQDFAPARDAHIRAKPSVIRESRSSAVLQALLDMQDQLRRLQHEKSSLNRRFEELTEETSRYKAQLDGDHARSTKASVDQASLVRQLEEAREQLERARARKHRTDSVTNPSHSYQSPPASPSADVYLDDNSDTNGDRYGDDDSGACDSDGEDSSSSPLRRRRQSKPRHQQSTRTPLLHHVDGQHYHLDLAHLPFVVGQSTAPSHSLAGNLQTVLSELKRHHPVICDHVGPPPSHRPRHCRATGGAPDCCSRSTISSRAKQTQRSAPGRPCGGSSSRKGSCPASPHLDRRQVLHDMRTLRTVLHRDDVCWT